MQQLNFDLQQLALKYGVQYIVAGHVHQIVQLPLGEVTYSRAERGRPFAGIGEV